MKLMTIVVNFIIIFYFFFALKMDFLTGHPKKSVHESEGKTALKNEDDLAES